MTRETPVAIDDLRRLVREVPDFPQPGILFRDITTLLADPAGLNQAVAALVHPFAADGQIDFVVGVEARGFILGAPVALELRAGFIPARKEGKLPAPVARQAYDLEYGRSVIEIHSDAFTAQARILVVDDVLATGGTIRAVRDLIEKLSGDIVGFAFLVELGDLGGRAGLDGYRVESVLEY